jgi:hypothetical protein
VLLFRMVKLRVLAAVFFFLPEALDLDRLFADDLEAEDFLVADFLVADFLDADFFEGAMIRLVLPWMDKKVLVNGR